MIAYRQAVPEDTAYCIAIRGRTRKNAISAEQLFNSGITLESWAQDIRSGNLWGMVCLADQLMVGYCFGDRRSGEIVVLAILPDWEARGMGKLRLHGVIDALHGDGCGRRSESVVFPPV
jgi:GNAT superfamily N-acetyltransferase